MREIVLFMVDSWAERAHLGSASLDETSVMVKTPYKTVSNNEIGV